ncbi:hypothetical protein [Cupriavidus pinatubonensis]|uniref:hypothetical protein n=1 Tax=Cupriavidus pinatubonensis TaxID=248026 RepID=UPI001125D3B5|nr:hypothetical protein [Cupriavidus pinatubonensis]TPQ33949.1 hypothetical protein C2U69_23800 [Cupriavidus pinatubonensis]
MEVMVHAREVGLTTVCNLVFPTLVTIEAAIGPVWGSHCRRARQLRESQRLDIQPFYGFDLSLGAGAAVKIAVNWSWTDELPPSAARAVIQPLSRMLAFHAFARPELDWTLELFAARACLTKKDLSRRLFAEGTSFRQALRTNRLSRLLIDLPGLGRLDGVDAVRYGFADRCQAENAVFDRFGLSLFQLQRLVRAIET